VTAHVAPVRPQIPLRSRAPPSLSRRRNWSSRSATPSSNGPRSWSRRRTTTPSTRPRRPGSRRKVEVAVDTANRTITVVDHGHGLAAETVEALVDLTQKVSSRAGYVSPTRGQQGNALRTILAMPCALDNTTPGEMIIEARAVQHRIAFEIDPLREVPSIRYERAASVVRDGTRIAIRWPERASSILEGGLPQFFQAATAFAAFNPHLELAANWNDRAWVSGEPTVPDWKRWRPSDP
jgi:hypothetical protein